MLIPKHEFHMINVSIRDRSKCYRRKQLSMAALTKLKNVWIRKDKIKQVTKLKLYRSIVKPILTYNSGTWGPTKKEEDELDAFHRKQLRRVLNVNKYPVKMKNKVVYRITSENILSLDIMKSRFTTSLKA